MKLASVFDKRKFTPAPKKEVRNGRDAVSQTQCEDRAGYHQTEEACQQGIGDEQAAGALSRSQEFPTAYAPAGYYSPEMKMLRAAKRGQLPGPIGPLQMGTHQDHEHQSPVESVLLAAAFTKGKEEHHAQGHATHGQQRSGLAQAMRLAAALKGPDEEHEQGEEQEKRASRKPASTTHAKQSEKPSSVKEHAHAHQSGK